MTSNASKFQWKGLINTHFMTHTKIFSAVYYPCDVVVSTENHKLFISTKGKGKKHWLKG